MQPFLKFQVMMQKPKYYRNNKINFNTFLGEVALMSEFIIINERTGNRII